jgi:hypothetical protein
VSRVFDSQDDSQANAQLMSLELSKSATDGSMVVDLSKVPDQLILNLLSALDDRKQPTVVSPRVTESKPAKDNDAKRNHHRRRPVKRARKRLRVLRKTLQKTVTRNSSKLLY